MKWIQKYIFPHFPHNFFLIQKPQNYCLRVNFCSAPRKKLWKFFTLMSIVATLFYSLFWMGFLNDNGDNFMVLSWREWMCHCWDFFELFQVQVGCPMESSKKSQTTNCFPTIALWFKNTIKLSILFVIVVTAQNTHMNTK